MNIGTERFRVVAFMDPQPRRKPLGPWPEHITLSPWMQGYRLHATNRIATAASSQGPIRASVSHEAQFDDGVTVWDLSSPKLHKLSRLVTESAIKYGTSMVDGTLADPCQPQIIEEHAGAQHQIGDEIVVRDISVIGWHDASRLVFRTIGLQ